jgi:hypothetical protein
MNNESPARPEFNKQQKNYNSYKKKPYFINIYDFRGQWNVWFVVVRHSQAWLYILSIFWVFIPEGKLSSLIYGNMSDTFVYIYMYVCIYRSIVIKNISTCILEAESQNYRNCKWTSNCSVLNRSTPQQENTNIKYHAIYMEQFIFLNSFLTLCVSFVFHVSRPTGSISAIVTLYYLLQIITDMYKDSILIWNINLNTCG